MYEYVKKNGIDSNILVVGETAVVAFLPTFLKRNGLEETFEEQFEKHITVETKNEREADERSEVVPADAQNKRRRSSVRELRRG